MDKPKPKTRSSDPQLSALLRLLLLSLGQILHLACPVPCLSLLGPSPWHAHTFLNSHQMKRTCLVGEMSLVCQLFGKSWPTLVTISVLALTHLAWL